MYYIGTKEQCEDYNSQVTIGEEYDGVDTIKWHTPIAQPKGDLYAVKKHESYSSEMNELNSIREWYPNE